MINFQDNTILEAIKNLEWFKNSPASVQQAIDGIFSKNETFIDDLANIITYIQELNLVKMTGLVTSLDNDIIIRFERAVSVSASDAVDFIFLNKSNMRNFVFLGDKKIILLIETNNDTKPIIIVDSYKRNIWKKK